MKFYIKTCSVRRSFSLKFNAHLKIVVGSPFGSSKQHKMMQHDAIKSLSRPNIDDLFAMKSCSQLAIPHHTLFSGWWSRERSKVSGPIMDGLGLGICPQLKITCPGKSDETHIVCMEFDLKGVNPKSSQCYGSWIIIMIIKRIIEGWRELMSRINFFWLI